MTDALPLYIGDDWAIPFALKDAQGSPINLTGCTIGAVFWRRNQLAPALTLSLDSGIAMPAPATGQFTVTIPRALTANVAPDADALSNALPIPAIYGTRVQVFVTDPAGVKTTRAIVPIQALDPRTVL